MVCWTAARIADWQRAALCSSSSPLDTAKLLQPPIGRDYASTGRLSLTAHGQISLSMMCRLVAPSRLADRTCCCKTSATVPLGVEIPRRARSSFAIARASRREEKWGEKKASASTPSSYLHKLTPPWSWPRKQTARPARPELAFGMIRCLAGSGAIHEIRTG